MEPSRGNGSSDPGEKPDVFHQFRQRRNPFTPPPSNPSSAVSRINQRGDIDNGPNDRDSVEKNNAVARQIEMLSATITNETSQGTQTSLSPNAESSAKSRSTSATHPRSDRPRNRSTSHQSSEPSLDIHSLSSQASQVIKFPSETKTDSTVHFTLDVADDIENHLEEFCCFKRWGHFEKAHQYFDTNLKEHLDLPLVTIEYANLFLQQGAYRNLLELRLEPPRKEKRIPVLEVSSPDIYKIHFDGIQENAKFAFQSLSINDLNSEKVGILSEYFALREYPSRTSSSSLGMDIETSFDSTEVQVICQQLEFQCRLAERSPALLADRSKLGIDCWEAIYNDLLIQGRVWELSDLSISMLRYFGPNETWPRLLNMETEAIDQEPALKDFLERLCEDWVADEYDESTELAILTILVELVNGFLKSSSRISKSLAKDINISLQFAEKYASRVQKHSPHLVESRPFIRWVLTKEIVDRRLNCGALHKKLRGLYFEKSSVQDEWFVPSYMPSGCALQELRIPDSLYPPTGQLNWVLKMSRHLRDYETESICLWELIFRAEDPRRLFDELEELQSTTQGNNVSYFETCLVQVPLAMNESSRRILIRKLEEASHRFKPHPANDVCVYSLKRGLGLQQELCRLCPGYDFLASEIKDILRSIDDQYHSRGWINNASRPGGSRNEYVDRDPYPKKNHTSVTIEEGILPEDEINIRIERLKPAENRQQRDDITRRRNRGRRLDRLDGPSSELTEQNSQLDKEVQTTQSIAPDRDHLVSHGPREAQNKAVTWNFDSPQSPEKKDHGHESEADLSKALSCDLITLDDWDE